MENESQEQSQEPNISMTGPSLRASQNIITRSGRKEWKRKVHRSEGMPKARSLHLHARLEHEIKKPKIG